MRALKSALLVLSLSLLLSGCLIGNQKDSGVIDSPPPVVGGPGPGAGGDGEAIHGGDPDELLIDEVFTRLDGVMAKIERGELTGRIGNQPEICVTQPLSLFCETLALSAAQMDYVEDFLVAAAPHARNLLRNRKQVSVRFTSKPGAILLTRAGTQREVLAWIERDANGNEVVMLQDSVRTLHPARIFALLAHEVFHLTGEVTDDAAIPLFASFMGDGRRLADTAGAALASLVYLTNAARAPTLVGLYLIGGRGAQLKKMGSEYQLINEYGSLSRATLAEVNGNFVITALDWGNLKGPIDYRGVISWANGTSWSPHPLSSALLALVGDYKNITGIPTKMEWNGSELRMTNATGGVSGCSLLGPNFLKAEDWNVTITVEPSGNFKFANGSYWTRVSPR